MRSVITLVTGMLLTAATCSHAQGQPATTPASPGAARPAAEGSAKPRTKRVAKKHADAAAPTADAAVAPATQEEKTGRRDPFESLVGKQKTVNDAGKNLPSGKGGLQVNTLRIDGIVHSQNGMIAVVSNPQQRTYFLHEGDQLYDGKVDKIAMDGVSFHEESKDAFGKPVEREVNKRIYTNAGEEQ
jgi:Tfp pilus assembly protein PilP